MRTATSLVLIVIIALAGCAPIEEGPDLILTEGTVHLRGGTASALALDGDRVVAAGTDEEIRALAVDDTQEMTLDDAPVYGGFVDYWVDLEALGRWSGELDLSLAASPREVQARVRERAAGGDAWILGHGWDETVWPSSSLPDRGVLDEVTDERPVLLYRRTGDVGWVNGAALAQADVDPSVPGAFVDPEGRLTGIVAGPALRRIEEALPRESAARRREWLVEGLQRVAAAGVTTVFTAPLDAEAVAQLRQLEASADLPVRVQARLRPGVRPPGNRRAPDDGEPAVRITAVGLTVDGPFRPPLAALREPYGEGGSGSLWADADAIGEACAEAAERGLEIHVRVRGDRALATALEACPRLASEAGLVVGGDLLPRPAAEISGLRLAVSPSRLTHDLYWLDDVLGAERAGRAHAYRDALAAGVLVGLASEAPANPLEPMAMIRTLTTRKDAEGYPLDGWHAEQRISAPDALRLATGELGEGAVADVVVWSGEPLQTDGNAADVQAMVTIVAGRVVYSRPLVELSFEMQ